MHFEDRFIKQPQRFFDWAVVDLDQQTSKELVEVVLEAISFVFSNFHCEFHELSPFENYGDLGSAWTVPIGFAAKPERQSSPVLDCLERGQLLSRLWMADHCNILRTWPASLVGGWQEVPVHR